MAKIEVELDEFTDKEIIEEVVFRITKIKKFGAELKDKIAESGYTETVIHTDSMINEMKLEWLKKNINKVTLEQLEKL